MWPRDESFGALTETDVAATFAATLGIEYPADEILGACNPSLAQAAPDVDQRIGLLLPCNLVVASSDDGHPAVSILDPAVMERVAEAARIGEIATEARSRLEHALASIS